MNCTIKRRKIEAIVAHHVAPEVESLHDLEGIASTAQTSLSESSQCGMERLERGCIIPKTEERAITIEQLRHVFAEVVARCKPENWHGMAARGAPSLPLEPADVNLYHLLELFLLPTTASRQCSYVELVASAPQVPQWCVSPVFA